MSRRFDAWILASRRGDSPQSRILEMSSHQLHGPGLPTIVIRLYVEWCFHHHDAPIEVQVMRNDACILGLTHAQWICQNNRTVPSEYLLEPVSIPLMQQFVRFNANTTRIIDYAHLLHDYNQNSLQGSQPAVFVGNATETAR